MLSTPRGIITSAYFLVCKAKSRFQKLCPSEDFWLFDSRLHGRRAAVGGVGGTGGVAGGGLGLGC